MYHVIYYFNETKLLFHTKELQVIKIHDVQVNKKNISVLWPSQNFVLYYPNILKGIVKANTDNVKHGNFDSYIGQWKLYSNVLLAITSLEYLKNMYNSSHF